MGFERIQNTGDLKQAGKVQVTPPNLHTVMKMVFSILKMAFGKIKMPITEMNVLIFPFKFSLEFLVKYFSMLNTVIYKKYEYIQILFWLYYFVAQ